MAILRRWTSRRIFRYPCEYNSAGNLRSLSSVCGSESAKSNRRPRLMQPPLLGGGGGGGGGEIVGCSHGWLAMFNKRRNDLFLSDPFSDRRINLPAVEKLPDPHFNLDLDGHASVSKVILSSAPEDEDCRAMMTYGPGNRLAFCSPGRSCDWTPIGEHYSQSYPLERYAMVYEDIVYCSRRKLFTSIISAQLNLRQFSFNQLDSVHTLERHDWDIQDPNFPIHVGWELCFGVGDKPRQNWCNEDEHREVLENECVQIPHLVYAEESDQVFVAVQFVRLMSGSGSPLGYVPWCEVKGLSGVFPGKTYGFIVFRLDDEHLKDGSERIYKDPRCCTAVEDLDGMSMFVGINHSFAVRVSDADAELKPNCIYFTDAKRLRMVCCEHDSGVFDYATKTVSPLNHAHAHHLPFWFS